jgi:hypothetical protein
MRSLKFKSALGKSALAAFSLALASSAVLAQTVNLTAGPASARLPDGSAVPMWGYSCGVPAAGASCSAANPAVVTTPATATTAAVTSGWSPVVITVPYAGAGTSLTINLSNSLTFGANKIPTSLVIVGQLGGGLGTGATTSAAPDHSNAQSLTWPIPDPTVKGTPPAQGPRVQSFATEIAAGATTALTWSNLKPGTYLIESGTHPSIQAAMGLYGVLVVTTPPAGATAGTAYPGVSYGAEVPLVFSEIDPVQNTAVSAAVNTVGFSETMVWSGLAGGCGNPYTATGAANPTYNQCYPPAVNYTPLYYLINGVAFDKTNASRSLFAATPGNATTPAAGTLLVRLVNAGVRMHVPSIVGSQTGTAGAGGFALIAEDGNPLPGVPRVQSEVFMAAGKTYDVAINVPPGTASALPIYDRQLSLSGNATQRDAGMLAYIGVNGSVAPAATSVGAAAAVADTYNALLPGKAFTVADPAKGVMANDVRVYGVALDAANPASNGTVTLNANGTFTYVPTATATTDSFGYCANGTTTICAKVSLGAATIEGATGITMGSISFTSPVGAGAAPARFAPPGVLAAASDAGGYPLTVDTTTITASAGLTVSVNADGSFAASATAAGSYSFTFKALNSQGTQSATAGSATVVFPQPTGLKVTVLDGADHRTVLPDYRWVIEEDRTFYVDPKCTGNPLPAGCPVAITTGPAAGAPVNYGTNFHTSFMPLVATGCTGPLSCESGQTLQGTNVVCDTGNGICHPGTQQTPTDPSQVALDPTKRYYISILPGDGANPFIGGNASAPVNCALGQTLAGGAVNTDCGHGMGGAPIPAGATAVTVLTVPTPLPTATMSVYVYQDDYPLNGEQGTGGGVDVLAPQEAGLGSFQITIFDQAGGTGDATGQPTYDMFNQPLSNSLAGTIDPVTGLDACPVSSVVSANVLQAGANATSDQCAADPTLKSCQKGQIGMIVTCPKYESDGQTLSPMAGQAVIKNLYPGRYGVSALPGSDRIARGEEWVQTNTLDGQKAHDSFMRVGEPGYFQEFGPAGYHVSIGFANPKIINERRYNATHSGMCDPAPVGGGLNCIHEVKGRVTGSRLSRTPDQRLYSSGSRDALAFTQCYVSIGDPDGAEIGFTKCDADGNFDFKNIPAGNWKLTTFDQWNDQIIDGITQPVAVACTGTINGLCSAATTTPQTVDMGEIGVHQWQADLYTRTFIDIANTGVSDDSKPGLSLVATNIRFRDGSYSNFNSTDLSGNAGFNEVFPLFNWYVVEADSTRYKTTGVHVIYDAGGPADGSAACNNTGSPLISPCGGSQTAAFLANTYEKFPLPAELMPPGSVPCANADCLTEAGNGGIMAGLKLPSAVYNSTGRIDPPYWFGSYGWQGYIGQGNFLEFGKKPFAAGETGPIHGHVIYASTRPFDDPQLLLQLSWEPMIPHVRVNLYKEDVAADGVTPTLTLVDHTETSSFDDWAQGFRSDGKPNMNCPGQTANAPGTLFDPFFYALQDQPSYLDWYNNSLHGTGGTTALPYHAQYKCYDGMHTWNQLQPAPYDGMYTFPSVTGLDPASGKPSGSNCTACIANPDATDPYRVGMPMLPAGKYVVEVVVPPGYELVKEEDKNILIGDNYIAPAVVQFPGLAGAVYILPDQATLAATFNATNPLNATTSLGRNSTLVSHEGDTGSDESFWPCVGTVRQVPDFISLFPQSGEVAPFAGAMRPLCDRKEVVLNEQSSALVKFYLFTSTHVAAHFQGIILDDFTAEFDPFSPQFGEKFAPSYLPVGIKDWTGNEIGRVYSDQFGLYNGLNYSTWEVNPPNPTGYGPTMMTYCMNDAGLGGTPDPLFQPGYSQFCYELPSMPGQTGYFDTPVVPVSAFSEGYNHPDCAYPDATPAIAKVTGDVAGPWVSAPGRTLTITALGDQSVEWYGFTGPAITQVPFNQHTITRHYGFGAAKGTVTIGNVTVPPASVGWSDTTITVTVPAGVAACAVQQQAQYGGSAAQCGELVITTAAGKQSVDTVTVTIGGKTPTVLAAGASIQSAIDTAKPGDMIIVPAGTYNEMVVMWKPIRLQGVGAASAVIDANTQPAGRLLTPWRQKVVCLFGLTIDGRPRAVSDTACTAGMNYASVGDTTRNFATMVVDRLPFEATLGWDASLNGNLAEQLSEPSLLGAYEGAAITVLGKGVKFPARTAILDAFGASTGAAFPTNTVLLSKSDCGGTRSTPANPYPTNFYCNPSSIDGLGIRDSSQGGGGILVHAYAHNLEIANNRVHNNEGTMSGGITIGQGEHPDVQLANAAAVLTYPQSCETSNVTNLGLPFCFDMNVNIHHNAVVGNSSEGDELFSSTPAGAGGVSINTGADYYKFAYNWVCGNISTGDGGGFAHIGFIKNGDIEHNTVIFNQSTNPTITTNGGGVLVMGAPDADPTTCGVTTDQDCVPPPGTISPSDGTGPGLKINGNLILGNAADAGSGGGLRLQHVNGTDVLNFLNGASACSADLGAGEGRHCYWNSVNVTNNIIVNNVAGWDGGGVSMLDALAVNLVNNTIAANDSTASSGTLFQSLFAPLASSAAPTSNVTCGVGGGQSCPQIAGLVSITNSPVLMANIGTSPLTCPAGHGSGTINGRVACYTQSVPLMFNDAIWQNRSFYIGVGNFGTAATGQNQQKTVALFNANGTAAGSQATTGACPAGASYWELGFRGDTAATSHSANGFAPSNSVLSSAAYGGTGNVTTNPLFTRQYCNGSRTPPEAGGTGWAVPPGTNEGNAFPNPVFSLTPSAVVDEGNNWVNLRWGPLSLTTVGSTGPAYTGTVLANYTPATGSPAIGAGAANVAIPTGNGTVTVTHPSDDFFGATRPNGRDTIGAIEVAAAANIIVSCGGGTSTPCAGLTFPPTLVGATSAAQTLTLSNNGTAQATGIALTFTAPFARATGGGGAGGTCGATLNGGATCTINVTFTPTAVGPATGTLTIAASVPVTGSPVALSGTGAAATRTATVSSNALAFGSWAAGTASNPLTLTVTNTGNVALAGGAFTFGGGTPQPFSRPNGNAGGTCGGNLAVGASCTVTVRFAPTATGAVSRTLAVAYTGATVTNSPVTLSGTGVATRGALTVTPVTVTLPTGTLTGAGTVTVTNSAASASSVAITADNVAGAGLIWAWTKGTDTCLNSNLAPGASCTVTVNFSRVLSPGTHLGTISFTDTATGSPQSATLTGVAQ